MKYLNLLFFLFLLVGCKTEEDKFPEMPFFSPTIDTNFIFEEIEEQPFFYRDTKGYIFF